MFSDIIVSSLPISIGVFAAAAVAIGFVGTWIVKLAEILAERTGLGQAIIGAVLLGATTSLPGLLASVQASLRDVPSLAVANSLGGIAAQTVFLVIADFLYRRANLEHAAASPANLMQSVLLIVMLALPLAGIAGPDVSFFAIHPVSFIMVAIYLMGLHLSRVVKEQRMWRPVMTDDTEEEDKGGDGDDSEKSTLALFLQFALAAAVLFVAGSAIGDAAVGITRQTGLSESAVGAVFLAITTSLPELVTVIAAVRHGALALALADIVGGNTFDLLFIVVADVAYRDGSIYHSVSGVQTFQIAMTLLMVGILVMGLLRRERHGVFNIGFESAIILVVYVTGTALIFLDFLPGGGDSPTAAAPVAEAPQETGTDGPTDGGAGGSETGGGETGGSETGGTGGDPPLRW